jgi:HD-like signal output (HDOD) protein
VSAALKYNFDNILARIAELPTLPTIVSEINRTINDPMSSTKAVEQLMEQDQVLTTKVLKLVNSAYYAIPGGVPSLGRAIAFLGFDTVNQLVLSTSIVGALKVESASFDVADFWVHSLGVAVAAESIGKMVRYPVPADAFTAGLVHDLGKVILLSLEPEIFAQVVERAHAQDSSFLEAESELGLPSHLTTGALLAEKWNLPLFLQQSIKYHHTLQPEKRVGVTTERQRIIDLVCLANLLVHALKVGNSGHRKIASAPSDLFQRLSLDPAKDFKPLVTDIKAALERSREFLKMMKGEV